MVDLLTKGSPHNPSSRMTLAADRQGWWIGGSTSVLFHLALLILGATFLLQPARYHVTPGQTSTEMDLVAVPAPTPKAIAPPSPLTPPVSTSTASKAPALSLASAKTAPPLIAQPAHVAAAIAKPHVAKALTAAHPHALAATNSASQGAVQAEPDEFHNQQPVYPEDSQAAHEQGEVMLRVSVTSSGRAAQVAILQSSGYFRLDAAAHRAVLAWRFHPASFAGIPVASLVDVPVRFRLQ